TGRLQGLAVSSVIISVDGLGTPWVRCGIRPPTSGRTRMTDLAELLRAKRSEIVGRWLGRIAREPNHVDLSAAELRDHLPVFFDQLVEALAHGAHAKEDQSRIAASQHGEQRVHSGFNVDELVREYDLLGDTILHV